MTPVPKWMTHDFPETTSVPKWITHDGKKITAVCKMRNLVIPDGTEEAKKMTRVVFEWEEGTSEVPLPNSEVPLES